ncbi:MAG: S49 family peptidase, partial [Pyrinomonadaceae bacterium]
MSHEVMGRLANAPVMIAPGYEAWSIECLKGLAGVERLDELMLDQTNGAVASSGGDDFWYEDGDWRCYYRPYKVVSGVLMVPIRGMLLHDMGYQIGSWATGYTYIQKAVERGLADGAVHTIALVINSGGGEVSGNFDLADFIYNARSQKRIEAVVNEHAYSAAFSLASSAHQISLPRTGGVGSIGVLTSHVSYQKYLEENGIDVTLVFAGKHKVDGNSYESLPAPVKKRMQARIDSLYTVFAQTTSRNLAISEDDIRATEAATFGAEEAIELGLAHKISSHDDTLAALVGGYTKDETEDTFMGTKPEDTIAAITAADVEAARADGVKTGAQAERTRISAIIGCEEAKGRGQLANHIAMNTDMSAEDAKGILASSAIEAKVETETSTATKPDAFATAMGDTLNPEVGADGGKGDAKLSATDQIMAD